LKNIFRWSIFLIINKYRKIWKVILKKIYIYIFFFWKQTKRKKDRVLHRNMGEQGTTVKLGAYDKTYWGRKKHVWTLKHCTKRLFAFLMSSCMHAFYQCLCAALALKPRFFFLNLHAKVLYSHMGPDQTWEIYGLIKYGDYRAWHMITNN
jgi:hypothetical protein